MKRVYKNTTQLLLFAAGILVFGIVGGYFYVQKATAPRVIEVCESGKKPVSIALAGDLLIGGRKVWQQIVDDNYNPEKLLGETYSNFKSSDVTFANFEGIITESTTTREKNLPSSFSLRTDPSVVNFFSHFPRLVLSFANNHSADFGFTGINDTLKILENTSIGYVGIGRNSDEALAPRIVEINGVRIAFLAFTDLLPEEYYATTTKEGIARLSPENLKEAIKKARGVSDFVIVSIHTAADVNTASSRIPDDHERLFSRLAITDGADIVVGSQPHILQQVEKFGNGIIFYSLGIFLYDPAVSSRYPADHPLFNGTQFKGGGILRFAICDRERYEYELIPTRIAYRGDQLRLQPDSPMVYFLTRLWRWYNFIPWRTK